jgi:hypothetical protein
LPLANWWQLWVLWEQVRAAKGCSMRPVDCCFCL